MRTHSGIPAAIPAAAAILALCVGLSGCSWMHEDDDMGRPPSASVSSSPST